MTFTNGRLHNTHFRLVFILLSFFIINSFGCVREDPCRFVDPQSAFDSFIMLEFFSKETGKPLFVDTSKVYSVEKFKVFDSMENTLIFHVEDHSDESSDHRPYYTIGIRIHQGQGIMPINQNVSERIFIDLGTDRDTIDYSFKQVKTICSGSNLEYFKVSYNGKPVAEKYNNTIARLRIEK